MSAISEVSVSMLASEPPTSPTTSTLAGGLFLAAATGSIYYASPLRLTRVLVAAITETEKTYLQALETGLLSASDVNTAEMLATLQLKVSTIREVTLSNSLSPYATLREFLMGRTLVIVRCIWEVHAVKTHIEILKEGQLRADASDLVPRFGRVLVAAVAETENTYTEGLEMGLSPPDVRTAVHELLRINILFSEPSDSLQLKVSTILEAPSALPFVLCNTARVSRGWKLIIVRVKASLFKNA
ncbi:hypothetical protein B0H13DRAFT_2324177 [Mycena leptocephala]|nr:hypothetical protein B0H13DRAFT_2324177 [Mycena leptocephala]